MYLKIKQYCCLIILICSINLVFANNNTQIYNQSSLQAADVYVLNQDNQKVRFHDLMQNKLVVINFIFTSCEVSCPTLGYHFSFLANEMSEYMGKELQLISVSVDPNVDSPARLKAWSENFGDVPGWVQVTGETNQIEALLKSLQVYSADKTEHSSLVLLGNQISGEWLRMEGLSSISAQVQQLKQWLKER